MKFTMTTCVALGVPDQETAAKFYRDVLGFASGNSGDGWLEVRSGPMKLFFCAEDETTPTFDLACEDPDEALKFLLTNGFTHLDSGNDEHYVRDPFGTCFAISKNSSVESS